MLAKLNKGEGRINKERKGIILMTAFILIDYADTIF